MKTLKLNAIIVFMVSICAFLSPAQLRVSENVKIGFYGQVLDQHGKPVIGAEVTFDFVKSFMEENRTQSRPMKLQTDNEGKFALTGVVGYGLDGLSIRKDGYELSKKTRKSYVFGLRPDYKPNQDSPVIFKMWKLTGKEPLVGSSWHGKVVCDGTVHRFNLLTGHPDASGNLQILCLREPLNLPPANTNSFTYKLGITIVGGGIQLTNDEFAYLAPASGYLSNLTYGQNDSDANWDRRTPMPKEFYIKTADGHYGRLFVDWDFAFWQSPTLLKWDCSINPSGSRNLER
jgi:hypothetical protein